MSSKCYVSATDYRALWQGVGADAEQSSAVGAARLKFSQDAADKFTALVIRRNGLLDQTLQSYLRHSTPELRDTATEYIFSSVLKCRGDVTIRSVWVNEVTTAYLILDNNEVIEVMTHRAFTRTFRRRFEYVRDAPVDGGRDGERFASALKSKRPKQVGGGLMRGKLTPRRVKITVLSTRQVRPLKGY